MKKQSNQENSISNEDVIITTRFNFIPETTENLSNIFKMMALKTLDIKRRRTIGNK